MATDEGTLWNAPRRRNLSPHRVSPVPHWQLQVAHIRYQDAPPAFPRAAPTTLPSAPRLSPCAHSVTGPRFWSTRYESFFGLFFAHWSAVFGWGEHAEC